MVISDRHRCIFVHIQKTGGASIETVLLRGDPAAAANSPQGRRHPPAYAIVPMAGRERWGRYFKFAFVRNPWDRLVSWYHMCTQVPSPNAFARHVRAYAPTFEAFILDATSGISERTTVNQVDYVTDEHGAPMLDFVGRYETFGDDFARIRETLGLAGNVPHVNGSVHGPYRDYYSQATRAVVAERFARDIAYFGFRF